MATIAEPPPPLGHRRIIQLASAESVPDAKAAMAKVIAQLVPNAASPAVQAAAQSLLNVAMQTGNPLAQAKMIQEMRTIGTIGEWAWHGDRLFLKPTVVIIDDWPGEWLFDLFPMEAMPPDGRATKIVTTLRYAEVPLQEIRAEHAPNRTIERQTKMVEFSLVPYGIALEADLNLIDENELAFQNDMKEQVTIIQLSFLKTKKLACMVALMQGPFLDRIFLGTQRRALLDVKSTVKAVVAKFGVLNSMDSLRGLLQLKTEVEAFERDISKQSFGRMIFDSRVPYAIAYGPALRNNFINAAIVGPQITEDTISSPLAPLDKIFPTLLKHTFVRDPKLAAHGASGETRRMSTSKMHILDSRQYGTASVLPKGRDDFENMITTYIPNLSTGTKQEFTLRDAVANDQHFNEKGAITNTLHFLIKDLKRELQNQGIQPLEVFDPFVFAVHKRTSLLEKYKNTKDNFHVIDYWGDVEPEFLDLDQPARNGRAWRYFVLNSAECNGMKNDMDGMLCATFALIERLSNPDMTQESTRAFLAVPMLQQPNGPDTSTRMFTGGSRYQVPDLPGISNGKLTLLDGPLKRGIIADDAAGFVLGDLTVKVGGVDVENPAAIPPPRYPYGFGSMPGLLMLGELIAKGEIKDWLDHSPDLKVLGDFYKFALSLTALAKRCYPECVFLDGERYTPPVHKTTDREMNIVIALLSNTMFAVKYPYFLKSASSFRAAETFTNAETDAIASVLLGVSSTSVDIAVLALPSLRKLLASSDARLMLPSDLRGQMKDSEQLQRWVTAWHSRGLDKQYVQQHGDLEELEDGAFPNVIRAEVLRVGDPQTTQLFVLRMLLEALSSEFHLRKVDDEWFGALRGHAPQVLADATDQQVLVDAMGLPVEAHSFNTTEYANARHTISAQAFLQLQRLMRNTAEDDAVQVQYRLFLPANANDPSRPLDFQKEAMNVDFMDYAQTIATTNVGQSPLEATAFAHPSLFAATAPYDPANINADDDDDDNNNDDVQPQQPFFRLVRSKGKSTGRAMRRWRDVFRGYAGTELIFFHRENLVRRIEHTHQKLRDPLERMGAILVATSRATRQSLEAMLNCEQPIPLDTYALLLPHVVWDASPVLFTQRTVGNLFIRDYLAGLSTGSTNRVTTDSTHEVLTVNFNFHLVAGVTAMNSVLAIPDVFVSRYVKGGDLTLVATDQKRQNAFFVNLGGKYTREYVTREEEGMLSLAGIYHVKQFPVPLDGVTFKREPWPSSVFFNYLNGFAKEIQKRKDPEAIQNLVALHTDTLPTGLLFQGTTTYWNRKTGQFETQQGVGHLDGIPVERLRDAVAC